MVAVIVVWRVALRGGSKDDLKGGVHTALCPSLLPLSLSLQVPGCWGAQGYGSETTKMKHQVVTGDVCPRTAKALGLPDAGSVFSFFFQQP